MAFNKSTLLVTFWLALAAFSTPVTSNDWTLILAHSNDIWFQLDEVQADDSICYKPLPSTTTITTSTVVSTTPTSTTVSSTEAPSTTSSISTETSNTTSSIPTESSSTTSSTATESSSTASSTLTQSSSTESSSSTDHSSTASSASTETTSTTPSTTPTPADSTTSTGSSSSPKKIEEPVTVRPVNTSAQRQVPVVRSGLPFFADKINSSTPYFAQKVVPGVPYHADRTNSSVPFYANVVESSVPHHAGIVHSFVPYFGDKVNSTVPYFADVVTPESKRPIKEANCYGGVARHLTAIKRLEEQSKRENAVFLNLNAGGMLGGNIWFPILGSEPAARSIEFLNYTAIAIGHRDFDEGIASTVKYLKHLKDRNVNVLCTNMDVSNESTMKDLFKKSMIVDVPNRGKIGIVGFIGVDAEYLADTGNIVFRDEVDAIQDEIKNLFAKGANFIIALGSADYDKSKEMLNKLYDVDILVGGGGPNTFLYNGDKGPLGEKVAGPYPTVFTNQSAKRMLVQTTRYGKYLGMLNITVNTGGQIIDNNRDSNPVLLDGTYEPDAALQQLVDGWEYRVLEESEKVIGSTKTPIVTDRKVCWYVECSGGNLMADAARWFLERHTANRTWNHSISAAVWHGGAMTATELAMTPGIIKLGDILRMFPFANTLAVAKMSGGNLTHLLELSVQNYNDSSVKNLGEFLHISGMRVEYDLSQPSGSRISRLIIRDTSNPKGDWGPVNPNAFYYIALPSFIARGGGVYGFMENIQHYDFAIRDEDALIGYLNWTSPLSYGVDERILFVSEKEDPPCETFDAVGTVFLTIFLTLLFVGLIYLAYKFLYPKVRDRSGSVLSLIR